MKNTLLLIILLFTVSVFAQNYNAKVFDSSNFAVPFVKFSYKSKIYNSDSLGNISGKVKIGDTLHFNDLNFNSLIHIIKKNSEKIFLSEKYHKIPELLLKEENISNHLEVNRSKNAIYLSLRHDIDNAFLVKNNSKLIFNQIVIPIKYFSDKNYVYNENSKFSIQLFSNVDGLPNETLTNIIYFSSSKNLKDIHIYLNEKQVIAGKDFFIVLKAYEKSSEIRDKSSFKFNPYFLCNTDGNDQTYLQYRQKGGKWKIMDKKEVNGMLLNLNVKFLFQPNRINFKKE